MSSNQQRKEAEKRKLQRQQEHRAERAMKRRRNSIIGAVVAVVLVVAGVVACATITGSSSGSGGQTPAPQAGACQFVTDPEGAARPVGLPTDTNPPKTGTVAVTVTTNQGVLPLTLDRAKAPCTVASFLNLAAAKFFNDTPCHRLVTSPGLKVLQCGDPTGQGTGGPGYTIPDEKPTGLTPAAGGRSVVYPRGTLAMAKTSAPNSGGSQFFLVYGDSQLPPDYTVFGTVGEPGIKVLEKIAAGGSDGASSPDDGAPTLKTQIQTVTVAS